METRPQGFLDTDDDAFVSIVSGLLAKEAHTKRGLSLSSYINEARVIWATCETDRVYAVKLLFDPIVQPEFRNESEKDIFCALVARVAPDGSLVDAPNGYQRPNFPGVRFSHIVAGSPIGGEVPNPTRPTTYVLTFLDVLGFEALLSRIGLKAVYDLYRKLLDTALKPHSGDRPWGKAISAVQDQLVPALMWLPIHTAYFSDSLLLWVPYHHSHLQEFFDRCSRVFCNALEIGLPLRGSITIGEAVLDKENDIYLGTPLVEAARLEAKQNWIGVSLGSSFKSEEMSIPIPPESVMMYTPPMKDGGQSLFSDLVLDWPRVWRESKTKSAIERLESFCVPDLPEGLKQRYLSTIEFFKHSEMNRNWDLPEGATRIKA